ncbi:MAG: outer membrane lipoprotein carrier protein LolA [Zoogloeaceae bacterium]|jgi:hypothetical protein|nr:outer membrane lipoprotein carrier protein LolA [Zoogloeaceae bacterium]
MKVLFWFCALIFLVCSGLTPRARAEDILQDIHARLRLAPVIRGEFTQNRELARIKKPLVAQGRFIVARDYGMIWETHAPFAQSFRLTESEMMQSNDQGVMMRLSAGQEPMVRVFSNILFAVFSGNVAALARYFHYSGEAREGRWHVRFVPKDAGLARMLQSLLLSGARNVETVEMQSAAGDTTRIDIRAQFYEDALSADDRKRFDD